MHWHGLRLENRYDGVPFETQAPIPIGGSYTQKITFPDAGFYWYHPHIREDYGLELGLYGTIIVEPSDPSYWPAGRPAPDGHARRSPRRGRQGRAVPALRPHLHGHGPIRQRHADQRRTACCRRRPRSAKSYVSTSSTPRTPGSSTFGLNGARDEATSAATAVVTNTSRSSTTCCLRHRNVRSSTCSSRRRVMYASSIAPLITSTTSARSP